VDVNTYTPNNLIHNTMLAAWGSNYAGHTLSVGAPNLEFLHL